MGGDIGPEAKKELNISTFTDPSTRGGGGGGGGGAESEKLDLPAITHKKVEGT